MRGVECERNWRTVHHAHMQERVVRVEEAATVAVGHVIQIEDFHFTIATEDEPGEVAFRFDEASVQYAGDGQA